MKKFEHPTDNHADPLFANLLLDHGLEGYGLYIMIIELIAQNISKDDLSFSLRQDSRILSNITGTPQARIEMMMSYMIDAGIFEDNGGTITCFELAKKLNQSMTNSPKLRDYISKIKTILKAKSEAVLQNSQCHDTSVKCHDVRDISRHDIENSPQNVSCVHARGIDIYNIYISSLDSEPNLGFKDELGELNSKTQKKINTKKNNIASGNLFPDKKKNYHSDSKKESGAKKPVKKPKFEQQDFELAQYMSNKINQLVTAKNHNIESWARDLRLAREVDGIATSDLQAAFDFAHADDFWQANILSPKSLRKQYQRLDAQARRALRSPIKNSDWRLSGASETHAKLLSSHDYWDNK